MANVIPAQLINEVMSCGKSILKPEVGMCCTYFTGSDRYGYVVTKAHTPKRIEVMGITDELKATKYVVDGIEFVDIEELNKYVGELEKCEEEAIAKYKGTDEEWRAQEILYHRKRRTYTLRKNGRWVAKGGGLWDGGGIHLGHEETYLDPSF